jgi:hypothetical protein
MNDTERHLLFDIWITRNFQYIGITPNNFTCAHFKFRNDEHLVMVSIHSKRAFRLYEKFGGLQALKRASSSTGIHATLAKMTRVQIPNELLERIPIPLTPLETIDVIQGTLFADANNAGGILDSIIQLDLF